MTNQIAAKNWKTSQKYIRIGHNKAIRNYFKFVNTDGVTTNNILDIDSSTLSFSQQEAATPVPFEMNPTLGLLLVGGIVCSSRYMKHRKTINK